jgi:retinol dehydrogenase 12
MFANEGIGLSLDNLDYHVARPGNERYAMSKAGNWSHAAEFAKRYKADGIVSIPLNPGNLTSDLYRDQGTMFTLITKLLGYPVVNGAYTELFAGLSPKVTIEKSGDWGEQPFEVPCCIAVH